jgi:hypothetical protein
VAIGQALTVRFNMAVDEGPGFGQVRLEDDYLNPIEATVALDDDTLMVTPTAALNPGSKYRLTVPQAAVGDAYGHELTEPYTLSFTTTTSSPEVVFAYPGGGMEGIGVNQEMRLQMNQKIQSGPTFADITLCAEDSREVPVAVSLNNEWLIVSPNVGLTGNTLYELAVPSGAVMSAAGEAQQEDFILAFTTGEAPDSGSQEDDDLNGADTVHGKGDVDFEISRQTAPDGRKIAVIGVNQQASLKPKSGQEQIFTLDISDQVKDDSNIRVDLSKGVLQQLSAGSATLDLVTDRGEIRLPAALLATLAAAGKDISVTVERGSVETVQAQMGDVPDAEGANVLGTPTVIDTDIVGSTLVTLPLTGVDFPSDPVERAQFLNSLAAFVIHGDGEREVLVGAVLYDADGNPTGLRFEVNRFSTFAVIKLAVPLPVQLIDLGGHWAEADILKLVSMGAVSGYPDVTFKPDNDISRAEFATILVRALGLEPADGKVFADTTDHWAKDFISTAEASGIVTGYDEETFGPDDLITREQMAAMVVRAGGLGLQGHAGEIAFTDSSEVSEWAVSSVAAAAANGVIRGDPDGTFRPQANATRAEAATVVCRMLESVRAR